MQNITNNANKPNKVIKLMQLFDMQNPILDSGVKSLLLMPTILWIESDSKNMKSSSHEYWFLLQLNEKI